MLKLLAITTVVFTMITFLLGLVIYLGVTGATKYHTVFGIISLFLALTSAHYLYHGADRLSK